MVYRVSDVKKASQFYRISDCMSIGSFEGRTDEIKAMQQNEREQSYVYDYDEKKGKLMRRWNHPYAGRKKND